MRYKESERGREKAEQESKIDKEREARGEWDTRGCVRENMREI